MHVTLSSFIKPSPNLLLSRLLRITAHNLDLLRRHGILIIQLKVDVLDQKRPDFVAEAVGVKMALEVHARLDFVGQHFCDGLIEGGDDFHGGLGLDAAGVDEIIKRVDEGHADAATTIELVVGSASRGHDCGWSVWLSGRKRGKEGKG